MNISWVEKQAVSTSPLISQSARVLLVGKLILSRNQLMFQLLAGILQIAFPIKLHSAYIAISSWNTPKERTQKHTVWHIGNCARARKRYARVLDGWQVARGCRSRLTERWIGSEEHLWPQHHPASLIISFEGHHKKMTLRQLHMGDIQRRVFCLLMNIHRDF